MLNASIITVVVRDRYKVLYSGQAFAVTAINDNGPFDILAQHENLISLIRNNIIIRTTPDEKRVIQIENGIVRVYKDKVYIYVNFKS